MYYFITAPDSIRNVNDLLMNYVWQFANGDNSNEIHHSRGEYSIQILLLTYAEHSDLVMRKSGGYIEIVEKNQNCFVDLFLRTFWNTIQICESPLSILKSCWMKPLFTRTCSNIFLQVFWNQLKFLSEHFWQSLIIIVSLIWNSKVVPKYFTISRFRILRLFYKNKENPLQKIYSVKVWNISSKSSWQSSDEKKWKTQIQRKTQYSYTIKHYFNLFWIYNYFTMCVC